jgi:hypothetical protein
MSSEYESNPPADSYLISDIEKLEIPATDRNRIYPEAVVLFLNEEGLIRSFSGRDFIS